MISIRRNVFETNSSSTHSICICTEEDYKKWEDGEKMWDTWSNTLVDVDKIPEEDREEGYRFMNDGDNYLEWYAKHFTTPSGDKMVAFGYYGFDG